MVAISCGANISPHGWFQAASVQSWEEIYAIDSTSQFQHNTA